MGDHVSLFCRPFRGKPTIIQWQGLIDVLLEMMQEEGLDLVVIDPLAEFLPTPNENAAVAAETRGSAS